MRSPCALASPGTGQFCAVSTWQPGLAQLGSLRHNLQEPKAVSSDLGLHGVCLLTHTVFPGASVGSHGALVPMLHISCKAYLPDAMTPGHVLCQGLGPHLELLFAPVFLPFPRKSHKASTQEGEPFLLKF